MFSFHDVKSKWHYLIILAIAAKIILSYKPTNYTGNPDAESAIRRAKTDSCKRELEEFASLTSNYKIPSQLRRTCKLDSVEQRNLKVGCATNNTDGLVQLENSIVNSSLCLDLCFSYGHSHGGYNGSICFCGDSEVGLPNKLQVQGCHLGEEFDWYRVNNGIYYPGNPSRSDRSGEEIKIAFLLILKGRSILQIHRLLENIYSEKHLYYIHIDGRDNYLLGKLLPLEKEYSNVIIAKSRFNTIWGGSSLLRMIIDSMSNLISYQWDYLINLSESDFPIKPLSMLESYLSLEGKDSIYLRSHNIKGYNFIKKQGLNRNFYQCEDRVWKMGRRQLPRGIVYSGGSDWFALPREFCHYIVNKSTDSSETDALVKPLMKLFNYTLLPAESFFHTLALNSEFCDRLVDQNLRITNWHRKQGCKCQHTNVVDWCGCSPLVYRWHDWEKLLRTNSSRNLFFSRKFDPTISSSIIGAVEHKLVQTNQANKTDTYDTRYWQNIYDHSETQAPPPDLEQFGLFALDQKFPMARLNRLTKLKSVSLYFDKDRFVGIIYEYCDQAVCTQLLVEKNNTAHLDSFNGKCFTPNGITLRVIEVNHGFDTGERMFRDYKPLNDMSNIVVYHEWLVGALSNESEGRRKSPDNRLKKYSWWSPDDQLELIQNIKLKGATKPTKLSLAHRLNIPKPIKSGIWTLTISQDNLKCLNYRFPVFDRSTHTEKKISTEQFNKFYRVSQSCIVYNAYITNGDHSFLCSNNHWSSATSIGRIKI